MTSTATQAATLSAATTSTIPAPGEEATLSLSAGLILRHGSSLSLIANVCEFLANPQQDDTFSYIDPTGDAAKWKRKKMELYYAAAVDPTTGNILAAMRTATQGLGIGTTKEGNERKKRLLIDYVYTAPSARDKGIARKLIGFVLDISKRSGAYTYVLSLEQSAVYWMEKWGFYLCEDEKLNEGMNVFPDTHLLRLGTDPTDVAEADDENAAPNGQAAAGTNASSVPPDVFTSSLRQLIVQESSAPRSDEMKLCLTSLALLIKNATAEEPGGRRRRIKISNPNVRSRIFAVGGDHAMSLLQACGFELGVDEEGSVTLTYHDGARWLAAAVELLEKEAAMNEGEGGTKP